MVNPDMTSALQTYFHRDYPFLELNVFDSNPAGIQAKLLTESQASSKSCDVVQSRGLVLPSYKRVGAVKPAFLPSDNRLPKQLQDRTGYFHPMYIAANTHLPQHQHREDAAVDRSLQAGRPEVQEHYRDRQRREQGSWLVHRGLPTCDLGAAKWNEWMAGLKANGIRTFPTVSDAYQAVVRGDIAVTTDSYNDILGQKSGTPVAAKWYDGIAALSLVYRSSPTPRIPMPRGCSKTG